MKALLFINGLIPHRLPDDHSIYDCIICTDGAYTKYVKDYATKHHFTIDFLTGDMDSVDIHKIDSNIQQVYLPDQEKTDFEKTLDFLIDKGFREVDVYGGSGLEEDHFIGNISTALQLKDKINIVFYSDYSKFYFIAYNISIYGVKNKIISLIPFFKAEHITTQGLEYPLKNESLTFGQRIGIRNKALTDEVKINYTKGSLLLFISYE